MDCDDHDDCIGDKDQGQDDEKCDRWIRLEDGKAFSRLLYPNPVCFLTVASSAAPVAVAARAATPSPAADAATSPAGDVDAPSIAAPVAGPAAAADADADADADANAAVTRNVMVLSWLTPTNNDGRFMFSVNRRRHTASLLVLQREPATGDAAAETGVEFVLSVPVKGMERLVLDVGGTSGRWGSKFSATAASFALKEAPSEGAGVPNTTMLNAGSGDGSKLVSKRQMKKARRERLAGGVPGLETVPLGGGAAAREEITPGATTAAGTETAFAVCGTVAHLKCRTYRVLTSDPSSSSPDANDAGGPAEVIDGDHRLVLAEVIDAYVRSNYWDAEKIRFRPATAETPPYLTFLGSQTFGYVRTD